VVLFLASHKDITHTKMVECRELSDTTNGYDPNESGKEKRAPFHACLSSHPINYKLTMH